MTVAKLVMMLEARTKLSDATRAVNAFVRDVNRSFSNIKGLTSLSGTGAFTGLRQQFSVLSRDLSDSVRTLRRNLGRGIIDENQFAREFEQSIVQARRRGENAIKGMRQLNILSAEQATAATQALDSAIGRATAAMSQGDRFLRRTSRQVQQLDRRFDAAEADRTIARSLGRASGPAFRRQGQRDAAEYNAGILRIMEGAAKSGKLTEPLRIALASKLKPEGFGVGSLAAPIEQGIQRATRTVDVLQRQFDRKIARQRFALAEKLISPEQFERRAFQAGQAFDRGLIAATNRLRGTAQWSESAERTLTSRFKQIGKKNADEGVFAAKEYVSNFRDTYNRAIQSARFAKLSGDLNTRQFRQASDAAARELSSGLKQVSDRLEAEGLLTPGAVRFLNSQFADSGRTSAKTFFAEFNKALHDDTGRSLSQFGHMAQRVGGQLTRFLSVPIAAVGVASLKLAGDAEQAQKRMEQMFGPLALDLDRELKKLQRTVPATSGELRQMAARFGELLIPLGIAPAAIAGMSKELIIASKNIGVFAGVSSERSMNAIINALIGQSRELKKLGIEIDDITIRDEVYRLGLARVGSQLTTVQKVMGAYHIILQRSGVVASTLTAQQNTFNVRLLFFGKALKEAGIAIGNELLPAAIRLLDTLSGLINRFSVLSPGMKTFALALAGIAIAVGPVLIVLGSLARTIAVVRAAYLGLQAATLASGGAAVTGGAFATVLGITGSTAALILTVAGAVTVLALGMKDLKERLGDFGGLSSDYVRSVGEMTRAEVTHALTMARLDEMVLKRKREQFAEEHGITVDPLGGVSGGDLLGRERREFIRMGEGVKEVQAKIELLDQTFRELEATQKRLNEGTAEWEKRIKATQDAANEKLLIETYRSARRELSLVTAAAAKAQAAIRSGLRIKDPALLSKGIEDAESALGRVQGLAEQFRHTQSQEEFAPIAKEMQILIDRAGALENRLKGVIETSGRSRELEILAARLSNVRAALTLGTKEKDLEALTRGFAMAAALQEDLTREIETSRAKGDQEAAERIQRMADALKGIIAQASRYSPKEFIKQVDETIASLRLLKSEAAEGVITSTGIDFERFDEAEKHIATLQIQELDLIDLIDRERAARRPVGELLAKQAEILRSIKAATPNLFETMFGRDFLPRVREIAREIQEATFVQRGAEAGGDAEAQRQALLGVIRARAALGALMQELDAMMTAAQLSSTQRSQVMAGLAEVFEKANIGARDFNDAVQEGGKRLLRFGTITRVLREVADAFGVTNEHIKRAIQSAGVLFDSLQRLEQVRTAFETRSAAENARRGKTNPFAAPVEMNFEEVAATISSMVGIVTSAVNIISALGQAIFGRSEMEREHDKVVAQNSERLEELASVLRDFTLSIGNQIRVQRALGDPRIQAAARAVAPLQAAEDLGFFEQGDAMRRLNAELLRFGLTFADINRIAEENGITLLDSKGRLVAKAFDQLVEAVAIAREMFFRYSDTLSDQQKKIELFNNVFDVPDDGFQAIRDNVALLQGLAPSLFNQFFAGVDLSNVDEVERAVRAMTNALLSGALNADETLKLLSRDELEQIILGVEGGLDALAEAAGRAAGELLNVPDILKLAAVRFAAETPADGGGQVPQSRIPPPAPAPVPIPVTPESGATVGVSARVDSVIEPPLPPTISARVVVDSVVIPAAPSSLSASATVTTVTPPRVPTTIPVTATVGAVLPPATPPTLPANAAVGSVVPPRSVPTVSVNATVGSVAPPAAPPVFPVTLSTTAITPPPVPPSFPATLVVGSITPPDAAPIFPATFAVSTVTPPPNVPTLDVPARFAMSEVPLPAERVVIPAAFDVAAAPVPEVPSVTLPARVAVQDIVAPPSLSVVASVAPVGTQGSPIEPGGAPEGGDTTNINGDVNIILPASTQDPEEQADALLAVLRKRKFNRTGTTVLHGIDDERPPTRRTRR